MITLTKFGFVAVALLVLCFGVGNAAAFVAGPATVATATNVTPVAMCGRSCSDGGSFIPGPPRVCEEKGLLYCGSSRGAAPGAGIQMAPKAGNGIDPGGRAVYVEPRQGCRQVLVQRWDGSERSVTRCD